ncbi:MAG: TetR/AcrR family transcriptional regulator [Saprospirales bacterium]|nr:TetR/AcrR family transcriptional regulator [Saprospirales bacterium]
MKSTQPPKRTYHMTTRADLVAQNEQNILDAMVSLWLELPIHEITLDLVAEKAGVTVRTVLRKYGSKEGLIEASIEKDPVDLQRTREEARPGDAPAILRALLAEYEVMGPAIIRTIAVEEQFPAAAKILEKGRLEHRKWCARVFEPYLPDPGAVGYERKLTAFITATEIYLWKLLRKDMGKSFEETLQVFRLLIEGIINTPPLQ